MSDVRGGRHYRLSILGYTLNDTLEEMTESQMVTEDDHDIVWKHFEQNLRAAIINTNQNIRIKGQISVYGYHYDIWKITLKPMELLFKKKIVPAPGKTSVITVPPLPKPKILLQPKVLLKPKVLPDSKVLSKAKVSPQQKALAKEEVLPKPKGMAKPGIVPDLKDSTPLSPPPNSEPEDLSKSQEHEQLPEPEER